MAFARELFYFLRFGLGFAKWTKMKICWTMKLLVYLQKHERKQKFIYIYKICEKDLMMKNDFMVWQMKWLDYQPTIRAAYIYAPYIKCIPL